MVGLVAPGKSNPDPGGGHISRAGNHSADDRNPGVPDIYDPYAHVPDEMRNSPRRWPLVKFDRGTWRGEPAEVLCVPNDFEVNNSNGKVEATRTQVMIYVSDRYIVFICVGATHTRLGSEHTQEPGSNARNSKSRHAENI